MFVFYFLSLLDKKTHIESVDVVLFEGILAFYFSEIRELFELKLFVDTDADTRLSRRGWYLVINTKNLKVVQKA